VEFKVGFSKVKSLIVDRSKDSDQTENQKTSNKIASLKSTKSDILDESINGRQRNEDPEFKILSEK
jgi:hypothetical protein